MANGAKHGKTKKAGEVSARQTDFFATKFIAIYAHFYCAKGVFYLENRTVRIAHLAWQSNWYLASLAWPVRIATRQYQATRLSSACR